MFTKLVIALALFVVVLSQTDSSVKDGYESYDRPSYQKSAYNSGGWDSMSIASSAATTSGVHVYMALLSAAIALMMRK